MFGGLTDDDAIATWAREPIVTLQPGSPFRPIVIGPADVPRVASPDEARRVPELAVLSALAHGNEERGLDVVLAALAAVVHLDEEHKRLYHDIILRTLNDAARAVLESMMKIKYEYKSDFALTYLAQGRAEGEAKGEASGRAHALLSFLAARGLALGDEQRDRILACTDIPTLDRWITRAAVAATAAEVFADN